MDSFTDSYGTSRTYQSAEKTAYTFGANDVGLAIFKGNGLMPSIHTRDVAASTPDAFLSVNLRICYRVAVQV